MLRTRPWVPYLYVLPLLGLLGLVFGYSIVRVFDFSMRFIRGASGPFVGLDNYRLVLDDPTFRLAAKHSALLLLAVPVLVGISLLVSVLLFERARGWRFYRSTVFLPYVVAVPIVGIIFGYLLQLNGVLNEALRGVGLGTLALDWLGSEDLALWSVLGVIVWREVGFGIIVFLARLTTLDESQLEAARIDGAGWWQRLRYVIVPQMKGTVEFYTVVATITMLAWVFAYIWTLTLGGPGNSTQIVELYIYNQGVRNSLPGMAAAVAVLLLLTTLVLIAALFRIRARAATEEGREGGMTGASLASERGSASERRLRRLLPRILRQLVLITAAVIALYPVFFMVTTALKTRDQYLDDKLGLPWPLAWGNFEQAVRGGELFHWFGNSVIFTVGSVVLSTIIAALAAFAIARMRFRGQNALLTVNVALMVVPPVVMLIPLFVLFTQIEFVSTYHGVILIYAGLVTPFSVYMLTGFFRAIPRELFESAVIDGASHLRILWRVVVPLSLPAFLTLVLVNSLVRVERAADRARVPADGRDEDADGRPDRVPVPVQPRRADHDGRDGARGRADGAPLPLRPALLRPRADGGSRQGLTRDPLGAQP